MSIAHGRYHIWTVGCQMNQADSQRVASILDGLGWEEVPTLETANLVVLNTCSVREQPEKKAHGQLSLLSHAKRHREDLLVAMMGCMIGNQRTIDDLKRRYPVVDLFFKVEKADILPEFLEERWTPLAGEGCVDFAELGAPRTIGKSGALPVLPMAPLAPAPIPTSRLADDDSTPLSRRGEGSGAGRPASGGERSPMQIVPRPAARDLHYPTAEEIGMRARGPTADLADLMERLSEIAGLARIRFMTSYPRHMTDKMIRQMAGLPKVCEHVNIPVQHGDDGMLQRMRRGYTLAEYRGLIDRLRAWWPGVSLSTDVIVGFCGETEAEFQHTLDLLDEIRFDVVHVAAYSPRPGTLAYKWEDDVPLAVKKARLQRVEQVQERIARELNSPYQGRVEEVLVEAHQIANGHHQWRGRTRTNKLVFFPATRPGAEGSAPLRGVTEHEGRKGHAVALGEPALLTDVRPGSLVPVLIERTSPWSLQGRLVAR